MTTSAPRSYLAVLASVMLLGCGDAAPGIVSMLVTDARVVGDTIETLRVTADLTNGTDAEFVRDGCLRPRMALDSIAGTEWVPLVTLQTEELIQCFRPFTVYPGATQRFDLQLSRASPARKFPRGTPLRLRVISPPAELEPFFIFTLVP